MSVKPLPARGTPTPPPTLKKIALEEHFAHPAGTNQGTDGKMDLDAQAASEGLDADWFRIVWDRLNDFDSTRIEAMDEGGIDVAILSLTCPGIQAITDAGVAQDAARQVNDALAQQVAAHPDRFKGFASLSFHDIKEAVRELERCVTQLEFKGVLVNGYSQIGSTEDIAYLDEEHFLPFWEKVSDLNVPVYLHPRTSLNQRMYRGHTQLLGATWGFAPETATHALRMVYSGLFDRFPKLNVILGHMGEMLPFFAWRIQHCFEYNPFDKQVEKRLQDYLCENFYITTSGNFSVQALTCALLTIGSDRILFSCDYPYEMMEEATNFMETCPIAEGDRRKIAHGNARQLFSL